MKSLIVGAGEVGRAMAEILGCEVVDKTINKKECDVLHICFPYSKEFEGEVKRYQKLFSPGYTIIHSTVPIGTCQKIGAYHSPVRGMHPNLTKSMQVFATYLAPDNEELKNYLIGKGLKIEMVKSSKDTEAFKLLDTFYYFWNIIFEKEVHKFCQENKLDFEVVYTKGNQSYNEGYKELGKENVIRPVLKHMSGEVGGHCIVPNAKMLANHHSFEIASWSLKKNKEHGGDNR